MLQQILEQEQEAKTYAKWIIANSSQVISQEIEVDKKSPTVTELLQNKSLFFLLESVRILDQRWWISWFIFTELENYIKSNYLKLEKETKKLFLLKLKNFGNQQTTDLVNNLKNE